MWEYLQKIKENSTYQNFNKTQGNISGCVQEVFMGLYVNYATLYKHV